MARRRCGFMVAAAALAVAAGCAQRATTSETPADVLIVTMDTARADRFSYLGPSPVTTSATDAVAAEGAAFLTAVAPSPITLVSHASLFTGQNPFVHGVRNNGDFALEPEALTMAEVFSDAGWKTAAFVGATVLDRRYGLDQGFLTYDDSISRSGGSGLEAYSRRPGNEVVDAALAWLSSAPAAPTFVWVHLYDPHAPYEPPEPEKSRYPDSPYDGAIAFTDRMVGRLLDGYRRAGRYDNALLVLVADHGESLGEHQERTHGVFVYDASVRIPLVMRGPGITPGGRISMPVGLIDVMPTVFGLTGLGTPKPIDGRDLTGVVASREESDDQRAIYIESLLPQLSFGWSPLQGLRTVRWKYIEGAAEELYDLQADPHELVDIAAQRPDMVGEMAEKFARMIEHEGSTTARALEVDDAQRKRLAALGYLTLTTPEERADDGTDLPDPRDRIDSLNRLYAAMTRFAEGDEEGAISDLEDLLAEEPTNHSGLATLGSLKFRIGDYEGAADAYHHAARVAPSHGNYSELEAVSLERLGRFEEALEACSRALSEEPDRKTSRDIRWRLLGRMGRTDVLIQETERAVSEDPDDGMARTLLEQARHGPQPSQALVDALEQGLAEIPGDVALTAALADAEFGLGDDDRADILYRQVLELRPDNLNAALRVGRRALDDGRLLDALEIIDIGVRHHPDNPDMQILVARSRMATGDYEAARQALVMAYRLRPGWAETWLAAGELGILEGLPEQSAANLDRAAAAGGDDPDFWTRLAQANRRLGREREAVAAEARAQQR